MWDVGREGCRMLGCQEGGMLGREGGESEVAREWSGRDGMDFFVSFLFVSFRFSIYR